MTSMNETTRRLLLFLLTTSWLLTAIYSAMTPSSLAPDEPHHFSYAYGIYQQGLTPFFDRSAIRTDQGEYNHLRHPPAYHFLLASVMDILHLDKDFTAVHLNVDDYRAVLRSSAIPPLRAISMGLYAVHLLGLYMLLSFLVERRLLTNLAVLGSAALILFIPSRLYILGTVNNDALVAAVWPFLALYGLRSMVQPSLPAMLMLVLTASLAAMTKITLLIVAIPFVAGALVAETVRFFATGARPRLSFWLREVRLIWPRHVPLLAVFIITVGLTTAYYANLIIQYGSVNPSYTQIYELPATDNIFHFDGPAERGWQSIANDVIRSSWRTTTGIFGHSHLYVTANTSTELFLVQIAYGAALLALVVLFFIHRRTSFQAALVSAVFLSVPIVFWSIWIQWNVDNWAINRHLGTQGRYSIGALEIGVIAVFLVWSAYALDRRRLWRVFGYIGLIGTIAALSPVLARPLFYARQNEHLFFAAKMPEVIQAKLLSEGFQRVDLSAVKPKSFVASGFREALNRTRHTNVFTVEPDGASMRGPLPSLKPSGLTAVEIAVWTKRGSRETDFKLELTDSENLPLASAKLSLGPDIEVDTVCLEIASGAVGKALSITRDGPASSRWEAFWKNNIPPLLLGVFVKPAERCG
ncbi:hypothetical protein QBK99_06085 [Corticibacterium sp. UT-5YL-CI-8]|nr:hypothetical protein [Tianweitania sp. UT-5YL-CI-8]